jgi:hypothetical protein
MRLGPIKNPEVRQLSDYSSPPDKDFWDTFPSNTDFSNNSSTINRSVLKEKIISGVGILTASQYVRGLKTVEYLKNGAPSFQTKNLPGCHVKNAPTTCKNGAIVTDNIASWVKQKIVSGPFPSPPLDRFRVNGLIALEQHEKIRIVLNVSLPEKLSFNSNIDSSKLEKIHMSSPRSFGYSVIKAGKNAWMSKFDLCDAYKNINCKNEDLRLQGFYWLDKFFVENRQIFGARSSVCNFDVFGNTLKCLALSVSNISSEFVHRQLDDVPVVGPEKSNWCQDFSENYKKLCDELNVKLAKDCPKFEKAFTNCKSGKVLGILFDTRSLCWSLPEEKRIRTLKAIKLALESDAIDLLSMQKLVGRLNDVAIMCPFLSGFKRPILDDLCKLHENVPKKMKISADSKKDLLVWAGALMKPNAWLPIPREPCHPPISFKTFISDAAGLSKDGDWHSKPGVASIGLDESGKFIMAVNITWPSEMIRNSCDSKGVRYGDKSTTLEMIGILIPLLVLTVKLKKQHMVFYVDNMNCIFGWENKSLKGDISASIIIRSIHLISSFLGSTVHVRHAPRCSDWGSNMVDRMSRQKTMSKEDRSLLSSFDYLKVPPVLLEWICNPSEDWNFPYRLLSVVKSMC